jgi:hypothetical protein
VSRAGRTATRPPPQLTQDWNNPKRQSRCGPEPGVRATFRRCEPRPSTQPPRRPASVAPVVGAAREFVSGSRDRISGGTGRGPVLQSEPRPPNLGRLGRGALRSRTRRPWPREVAGSRGVCRARNQADRNRERCTSRPAPRYGQGVPTRRRLRIESASCHAVHHRAAPSEAAWFRRSC